MTEAPGPMASAAGVLGCLLLILAILVWPGARRRPPPAVPSSAAAKESMTAQRPGRSSGLRWRWWETGWPARCLRSRQASSRGAKRAAGRAIEVVEALATQVRAGATPDAAWRMALEVVDGGVPDNPTPFSLVSRQDESVDPAWRALGAAWRLSEQTGAPLADVLDRLAAGLREELEVEAEVEASLAAPRATARLLAGLPLVGVALGELIGARPTAVLVGTPLGRVSALAGLLLAVAGQLWTRALVLRVVRAARAG
jgi:tight adherence protein B